MKHVTVKSPALKARADASVYIPNQVKAGTTVPVVILLHGVYGSHWIWNGMGKADCSLQSLIDSGQISPMILVTPSDGLWGDGSGYFAHNGKDFERWIMEDIPQLVHEVTGNGADAPLFLAGLSMGGYGALRIGASHPAQFMAFVGHSSITQFQELEQFVEEPLASYGVDADSVSVINAMRENQDKLPPFRFDCGVDDTLLDGNRLLDQQLNELGINHVYQEFPGGHEWPYWQLHVQETFLFFENVLRERE